VLIFFFDFFNWRNNLREFETSFSLSLSLLKDNQDTKYMEATIIKDDEGGLLVSDKQRGVIYFRCFNENSFL